VLDPEGLRAYGRHVLPFGPLGLATLRTGEVEAWAARFPLSITTSCPPITSGLARRSPPFGDADAGSGVRAVSGRWGDHRA
jgi:hypothetical protein